MPGKRNNRRSRQTRANNGQFNNNMPVGLVTIPRNVHGVANAIRVNLMYQETGVTTGPVGYITYQGNSIFDPQLASSGFSVNGNQQPQFHDAWATMYNKYRVLGSRITIRFINGPGNTIPVYLQVSPEDQLVNSTNAAQASVARFGQFRLYPSGPSTPATQITSTMTTARMNGVSPAAVLADDIFQANFGSNPADPWYWQVRYSSVDFSTSTFIYVFVHIVFDVVLSDPVTDDTND